MSHSYSCFCLYNSSTLFRTYTCVCHHSLLSYILPLNSCITHNSFSLCLTLSLAPSYPRYSCIPLRLYAFTFSVTLFSAYFPSPSFSIFLLYHSYIPFIFILRLHCVSLLLSSFLLSSFFLLNSQDTFSYLFSLTFLPLTHKLNAYSLVHYFIFHSYYFAFTKLFLLHVFISLLFPSYPRHLPGSHPLLHHSVLQVPVLSNILHIFTVSRLPLLPLYFLSPVPSSWALVIPPSFLHSLVLIFFRSTSPPPFFHSFLITVSLHLCCLSSSYFISLIFSHASVHSASVVSQSLDNG